MRYTVVWLPAAEQELAAIWLAAPDRQRVTQAANTIEQRPRQNPDDEGESRDEAGESRSFYRLASFIGLRRTIAR